MCTCCRFVAEGSRHPHRTNASLYRMVVRYALDLTLEQAVSPYQTVATFRKKKNELVVTLPLKPMQATPPPAPLEGDLSRPGLLRHKDSLEIASVAQDLSSDAMFPEAEATEEDKKLAEKLKSEGNALLEEVSCAGACTRVMLCR